jgi:hypothetical protein
MNTHAEDVHLTHVGVDIAPRAMPSLRGIENAFVHAAFTRKEKAQNGLLLGLSVQRTGETEHFERVLILRQLDMRRIDLDQDKWRFAAKGCEMSSANQLD